jgi:hypothetical protein
MIDDLQLTTDNIKISVFSGDIELIFRSTSIIGLISKNTTPATSTFPQLLLSELPT